LSQQQAEFWRTRQQKPPLPEEVRRARVQAEDALQSKDFERAVKYYEQGLAIEPMWPDGHFNAALVSGELQMYANAVLHMKRYLALSPNAKDAEAARDRIYVWEGKLQAGSTSSDENNGRPNAVTTRMPPMK
jgi:regulator of sirC expression with transglutaminase-like and TPR domain